MAQHPHRPRGTAPRAGCSIALYDGSALLMIQRALPPFANLWTFPGGKIEVGESADTAIRREVWEELGLIVDAPQRVTTVAVADDALSFDLTVFVAFMPRRAPVVSSEIARWDWVVPEALARYRTTPRLPVIAARCLAALDEAGP